MFIQTIFTLLWMTSLMLISLTGSVSAEIKGEIVSVTMIWDRASINRDTDIVRFKDRWFVGCREKSAESSKDAALRIISSKDGSRWESTALLEGPIPKQVTGTIRRLLFAQTSCLPARDSAALARSALFGIPRFLTIEGSVSGYLPIGPPLAPPLPTL